MLRAVSVICVESQPLLLFSAARRRDVCKLFRTSAPATVASDQSVVRSEAGAGAGAGAAPPPPPTPPPPPPPPPPPRRAWPLGAAALALTASAGGVYFYRKLSGGDKMPDPQSEEVAAAVVVGAAGAAGAAGAVPARGDAFPARVQYLVAGAGTAAFAAARALRSQRPRAQVLLVGAEPLLPYMRPPLSKELWRDAAAHARLRAAPAGDAAALDALTFTQWNGRTRSVSYEPAAFYTAVEELGARGGDGGVGGAAVARGWRVVRVDAARHEAELRAPGCEPVTIKYDKCLIATGVRPRRLEALRAAARAGRAVALRGAEDARALAAALDRPGTRTVALVGGGFLATELAAALAERLRESGKRVVQIYREEAPLARVLPPHLAAEAARRLREAGVTLVGGCEIVESSVAEGTVRMRAAGGALVCAQLVVECVGGEVEEELARASQLELHPALGGVVVNAELQARADVFAAGDAACYYDAALGRRRVEHHDHAVASGRLAGENMAAGPDLPLLPAKPYTHQAMFWSDLGPHLGYEAIGIIDSRLRTVGVFSADAVTDAAAPAAAAAAAAAAAGAVEPASEARRAALEGGGGGGEEGEACGRRYERGVVFYLREGRVVGVLLWNLFNRMHLARQVLARGQFEDLLEVGKLFALHEDE